MINFYLLGAVAAGIAVLLVLILYFRIQAFISLLIASITVGLIAGMSPTNILATMQQGMASTLGFVAVVVGLGGMFGAILEHSGGANALAHFLLGKFGQKNASWALMLTGFLVAIPVFFDVAFIILIPLVYALQRKTGASLLLYAIPLLAGLAITHAFIPPTPGPVAVADIVDANLGMVILFGALIGLPTAIITGPLFGRFIAKKIQVEAPAIEATENTGITLPSVSLILSIIGLPIFLILSATIMNSPLIGHEQWPAAIVNTVNLLGHPFTALILANLVAWYMLGIRKGVSKETLLSITTKSMGPAGIIILLTGAGGVFKQMLIDTGTGTMLANYFAHEGVSIMIFAYFAAALVRVLQGSSTVAMITAAGIASPMIPLDYGDASRAMLVIAIAAGASVLSHVNDSGFWLVSKYLGLNEKQTFKSWTMMTTLLSVSALGVLLLINLMF